MKTVESRNARYFLHIEDRMQHSAAAVVRLQLTPMGSFPPSILLSRGYEIAHQPESNTMILFVRWITF
jgi:hypothetical protein